jgi:hypothetical protein
MSEAAAVLKKRNTAIPQATNKTKVLIIISSALSREYA